MLLLANLVCLYCGKQIAITEILDSAIVIKELKSIDFGNSPFGDNPDARDIEVTITANGSNINALHRSCFKIANGD